ncbi:response regulator [Desulfovermiculus halophilus]|uniref:response regulator n=1 Tax=Desulfovermiculus halophilus TaxID=339722 RepID=UPI000483AAF0|nr:response regulator [Desulfovermiculus halophilus]
MKIRVLVVDDEEQFVQQLAERLRLRDYDVNTALNGDQALNTIQQYNFDVVILDVAMPGIDGIETLREIKNIKPLTEVIMLTGHATVESAIEGMKLGAFDYLIKPTNTEDLVMKVNSAYARKANHEERIRQAKANEIFSSPLSVFRDK